MATSSPPWRRLRREAPPRSDPRPPSRRHRRVRRWPGRHASAFDDRARLLPLGLVSSAKSGRAGAPAQLALGRGGRASACRPSSAAAASSCRPHAPRSAATPSIRGVADGGLVASAPTFAAPSARTPRTPRRRRRVLLPVTRNARRVSTRRSGARRPPVASAVTSSSMRPAARARPWRGAAARRRQVADELAHGRRRPSRRRRLSAARARSAEQAASRSPRSASMSSRSLSRTPSVCSIGRRLERPAIERDERGHPVERLRDAGRLVELRRAELLHERRHLSREAAGAPGSRGRTMRQLLARIRDSRSSGTGSGASAHRGPRASGSTVR